MRRAMCVLLVLASVGVGFLPPARADRYVDPFVTTKGETYAFGEGITIRFVNLNDRRVRMDKYWRITQRDTGEEVAFYQWPDQKLEVRSTGARSWTWHQLGPACYGECQNVSPGEQVEAGRYEVTMGVEGETLSHRFTIGQYFTLGFEGRPGVEFVVFVGTQPEIDQMEAEAASEDKSLIVSGTVRKGRDYNPDWNFSMGENTIVLGEVFIEVCDASPNYVQRHREEWLGEQWCPWSSYVARVGR